MGSAYFARKQYELASETYQKALAIDPQVFESRSGNGAVVRDRTVGDRPTFFYYLAKSYAKAGMNDQALNYIRKALEEGFKERKKFAEDPEFAALQKDPEFQNLMARSLRSSEARSSRTRGMVGSGRLFRPATAHVPAYRAVTFRQLNRRCISRLDADGGPCHSE